MNDYVSVAFATDGGNIMMHLGPSVVTSRSDSLPQLLQSESESGGEEE